MITKELDTIESKLSDLEVEDTTDSPMSKGKRDQIFTNVQVVVK